MCPDFDNDDIEWLLRALREMRKTEPIPDCKEYNEHWIAGYVDGTLSDELREVFEKHLTECDACFRKVMEMKSLKKYLEREKKKEMRSTVLHLLLSIKLFQIATRQLYGSTHIEERAFITTRSGRKLPNAWKIESETEKIKVTLDVQTKDDKINLKLIEIKDKEENKPIEDAEALLFANGNLIATLTKEGITLPFERKIYTLKIKKQGKIIARVDVLLEK